MATRIILNQPLTLRYEQKHFEFKTVIYNADWHRNVNATAKVYISEGWIAKK